MIALLQRVLQAEVHVEDDVVGRIATGLLVFIGIEIGDDISDSEQLLRKVLNFRVFDDEAGKMNRSLLQIGGELLLIPQFTLAADTRHGHRPSFSNAASPELARPLFGSMLATAGKMLVRVQGGRFGAHMQVHLVNDGPATFWLETPATRHKCDRRRSLTAGRPS